MPALALTWNPVPGGENTAPRGEFTLKKSAGRLFGAESASGTPSQLISRRPLPNEPATLGFNVPRSFRKASTDAAISGAVLPVADTMIRPFVAPAAKIDKPTTTSAIDSPFITSPFDYARLTSDYGIVLPSRHGNFNF